MHKACNKRMKVTAKHSVSKQTIFCGCKTGRKCWEQSGRQSPANLAHYYSTRSRMHAHIVVGALTNLPALDYQCPAFLVTQHEVLHRMRILQSSCMTSLDSALEWWRYSDQESLVVTATPVPVYLHSIYDDSETVAGMALLACIDSVSSLLQRSDGNMHLLACSTFVSDQAAVEYNLPQWHNNCQVNASNETVWLCHIYTLINEKKLDSLQHLIRTNAAKSQN